jgi:hypothetical protein
MLQNPKFHTQKFSEFETFQVSNLGIREPQLVNSVQIFQNPKNPNSEILLVPSISSKGFLACSYSNILTKLRIFLAILWMSLVTVKWMKLNSSAWLSHASKASLTCSAFHLSLTLYTVTQSGASSLSFAPSQSPFGLWAQAFPSHHFPTTHTHSSLLAEAIAAATQ